MSRAALLSCTALALLFSVGAAHAQQGNLPTPVQKLPAYPPVAGPVYPPVAGPVVGPEYGYPAPRYYETQPSGYYGYPPRPPAPVGPGYYN